MILLVDPAFRAGSLSMDEFVLPVGRIVERNERTWRYRHYADMEGGIPEETEGVIICGTALKDNGFLSAIDWFDWLKETEIPVLGICAGMQVLCLACGGTVREGFEIGMTEVHVTAPHPLLPPLPSFHAYELHSHSCEPPPGWEILAVSSACIQAIRDPHHPRFGVMFHPEVRNDRIVEVFLEMCIE
ncbi:MAG TPA: gamma-glutamyl-gamma-aminobutyrate hydrolase family protein [Methanolinea sp.]|nr:gamma-glutamyl-gamma-aminobutyrate hydrolase family protein [Methanolinea sp.]HQK55786.1 gamma-glutamyl-gamma-aminobutyrate hydrolase family protein [Methanolinea sp.]